MLTFVGIFISTMEITFYQPAYQPHFERLNKAWLTKYFELEPIDEFVLTRPEEAILRDGGEILFAVKDGEIIGTVALKKINEETMELTKMAVDERFQGLGAGKLLCKTAIERARSRQIKRLILFSQTFLKPALSIYRKCGFRDIPVAPGHYRRADVMMEITFDQASGG